MAGQPLVGRQKERTVLLGALESARAGTGRLVVVTGAAGIGKTRLAEAAIEAAHETGLRVARGYAVADAGAPPLWPWQRVLRGRTADLAPGDDAAARFQHYLALTDVVRSEAEPDGLLLVLDDLHWADAASLQLLRHVANELDSLPLALVATARGEADAPWRAVLPDLLRSGAEVVELSGLAPADLAEWQPTLAADPERAAAVHAATGGNPLLVRLIAADLDQPLDTVLAERPELRRVVAARVLALPPDAREVVEAASVLGERIVAPILAQMTGRDDVTVELDLARQAGVLRGQAFEHALVRDAVYADLSDLRRIVLHGAAAEALEASTTGLPGMITEHWLRAGEHRRCLAWAMRADDAARTALAYDDAARYAELAVSCARMVDDGVAQTLIRLAEVQLLQGLAEASAHTCVAAAAAAAPDDAELVADAALVVHGSGLPDALRLIEPLCERALTVVDPSDHSRRARLLAQLAIISAEHADAERARALAADAMAEADRCADRDALFEAVAARHFTLMVPETVAERYDLAARAIALADCSSRPTAALWGRLWRLGAALQLGLIDEVYRQLAEIGRVASDGRSLTARWHYLRHVAMLASLRGEFDRARDANDQARQIADQVGDISMSGLSIAFAAQLALVRGDISELPDNWEQFIANAPPMPLVRVSVPILHAIEGRMDEARAEFAAFRTLPDTFPRGVRWAATLSQTGVGAVLLDDAEVAAAVFRQLEGFADQYQGDGSGGVFTFGACALPLADLARVAGQHERAIQLYEAAIALDTKIGARPFTALSQLGLAQALQASGAPAADVGRSAADAAAEFERLDMPGPLRRARALLEVAHGPSLLTARESEIAQFVARSLSNREIAQRLVLSERTVETHVRNILTKLGFTSRTEIVAWVLRAPAG